MTGHLATFLLGVLLSSLDWWRRMDRQAERERRLEGLVPFGPAPSNVRVLPRVYPPYDQEADRG